MSAVEFGNSGGVVLIACEAVQMVGGECMQAMGLRLAVIGLAVCSLCGVVRAQEPTSADKSFIEDAGQGSLGEINVAKLALQKSQDKNVRDFATKMIHDHAMLIEQMKPLAVKYHVKPPTGPSIKDRAIYEELKIKSGSEFDKAYVEAMVKDHDNDLKAFLKEEHDTQLADLKAVVAKGETVIRGHAEMIDNIAHMGGIQTPPLPS